MSNLSEIGKGYLAEARELVSSSWKYFLAFFLIIVSCWLFSEAVFRETKFQDVRLNMLYEKINSVKGKQAKSNPQQRQLDSLKRIQKTEEAANFEAYKDIEANVPGFFKIILRQATRKPFGVIILSFTVLGLLWYAYQLRSRYLRKVSIALRIIKESEGYNTISDYNFDLPYWVHPLPANTASGVLRADLLRIGGHRHHHRYSNFLIGVLLFAALLLQGRLFYFSLISNYALLDWGLLLQALSVVASFAIVLLWLLPAPIPDQYKSETAKTVLSRKKFVALGAFACAGLLLGWQAKGLGRWMAKRQLRPRYVMHKKTRQQSPVFVLEQKALPYIKKGNYLAAAHILFTRLQATKPHRFGNHVRNFALLVTLCRQNPIVSAKYFDPAIRLLKSSGRKELVSLASGWQNASANKIRKKRLQKIWNEIKG